MHSSNTETKTNVTPSDRSVCPDRKNRKYEESMEAQDKAYLDKGHFLGRLITPVENFDHWFNLISDRFEPRSPQFLPKTKKKNPCILEVSMTSWIQTKVL
jgi:hypothetical protein